MSSETSHLASAKFTDYRGYILITGGLQVFLIWHLKLFQKTSKGCLGIFNLKYSQTLTHCLPFSPFLSLLLLDLTSNKNILECDLHFQMLLGKCLINLIEIIMPNFNNLILNQSDWYFHYFSIWNEPFSIFNASQKILRKKKPKHITYIPDFQQTFWKVFPKIFERFICFSFRIPPSQTNVNALLVIKEMIIDHAGNV